MFAKSRQLRSTRVELSEWNGSRLERIEELIRSEFAS